MDTRSLARSLDWRRQRLQRRLEASRDRTPLERRTLPLVSAAGYPLAARLTRVPGPGALPGLVVSPAIHHGMAELETTSSVVNAAELARLGYAVLTFDPAGRGESWGEEDFGGPEHQDDLRVAIRALLGEPDVTSVAVLALSMGIVSATAALARWPDQLPVRWLLDWEGPSDREVVTTGGTQLVPAAGHGLDDEDYWQPREAVRHVGRLRCGYVRLQALPDHAQGRDLRHAERMVRAAAGGTLAWFQLNDHPRGTLPARPDWLPAGMWHGNRALLRKLADLR